MIYFLASSMSDFIPNMQPHKFILEALVILTWENLGNFQENMERITKFLLGNIHNESKNFHKVHKFMKVLQKGT